MKRSEKIVLGTVGVIAVAAFWPSSTPKEQPADAFAYASAEECRQSGDMGASECDAEWAKASDQHIATAQKFTDNADCEKAHGSGQCRTSTWNGANVFVPAMIGYMISRQLGGGGHGGQPLFPAGTAAQACPSGFNPQLRPDCAQPATRSSGSAVTSSGRSTTRWYRTSSGGLVVRGAQPATARGNAVAPRSATSAPSARTSVVSRGGFGSTGRSIGRSGS